MPPRFTRRASWPHVDLLTAEAQSDAALAEHLAPHAEHPHVPVNGLLDVVAVEHHVVDAVDKCHANTLLRH